MNFELGYVGRIVLFLVLLFGGCCTRTAVYIPQKHCPLIYKDQADLVRQLRALRAKKFADVRASVKGSE